MEDLQRKIYDYFLREPKLKVLFIFDAMDAMPELDVMEWQSGYSYIKFDGAWFSTKYKIEHELKDTKVIIKFAGIPSPHGDSACSRFYMMDLLRANMEYKSDSADVLLQQYDLPETARSFVMSYSNELQMKKYKEIVEPYLNKTAFSMDIGNRAILSGLLDNNKLMTWEEIVIELMLLSADGEKFTKLYDRLSKKYRNLHNVLQAKLKEIFGCEMDTMGAGENKLRPIAQSLKYNLITQQINRDKSDIYFSQAVDSKYSLELMNNIIYKANMLGENDKDTFFSNFEKLSDRIKVETIVATYGIDAHYAYLTKELSLMIFKELFKDEIASNPDEVISKMNLLLLKNTGDESIAKIVKYCTAVAMYYRERKKIVNVVYNSAAEYVARYVDSIHLLDMYYRQAVECQAQVENTPLLSSEISAVSDRINNDYESITNDLNVEWTRCLVEKGNGLKDTGLRLQHDFFNNELTEDVKHVVIVCDALRYETAVELMETLHTLKYAVSMHPMLAELPTETKFCKMALFPHNELKMTYNAVGKQYELLIDGQTLSNLDARSAYLKKWVASSDCYNAREIISSNSHDLREMFKKDLIYIFYNTLDEMGHDGNGRSVTDACKRTIDELKSLVKTLHSTLNVTNVVITSDHGFLFNNKKIDIHSKLDSPSDAKELKNRYYITDNTNTVHGIAKFPWNSVAGVANNELIAVPTGTNRFTAFGGGYEFTHGGASLQELVIPVIMSKSKRSDVKEPVGVTIIDKRLNVVSSNLQFGIIQSEAVSDRCKARDIKIALYDDGRVVSNEQIVKIESKSVNPQDRIYPITLHLTGKNVGSMLKLKVFDVTDMLNPIEVRDVINDTLIEQDF